MSNDSYATAARPDQKPFIWKDRIYRLLSHYGRCQNNWFIRIINSCTHFAIFYHLIPLDSLKMHCAGNINMKRFYMIWHICTVYVYCTPSRLKYTWCISDIISCQYIIITYITIIMVSYFTQLRFILRGLQTISWPSCHISYVLASLKTQIASTYATKTSTK